MNEQQLIANCKSGDRKAFQILYSTYSRRMMGVAMRYCNDTSQAEDVIQETFIKVYKQLSLYEGKGSFEGWIRRIVVNIAINHYHARRNRVDAGGDADDFDTTDDSYAIEGQMEAGELLEIIEQLPDGYRYVFNMYVIEGYTHKEIADQLQISEGTSKSQLAKAKALLRKIIIHRKMVA